MQIIFLGNQKLVQGIKPEVATITDALEQAGHQIIARITTKDDLTLVPTLVQQNPGAIAVLASFGFIVPTSITDLFAPLGILNIHPSLLPKHRGATPIESTILSGDSTTGISIMQLAKEMDAGPIYAQKHLPIAKSDDKFTLADKLTTLGATTLVNVLKQTNPTPSPQQGTPTFTTKLDKSMSPLDPKTKTAEQLHREVRAFLGFPKSKYTIYDISCTILATHTSKTRETPIDLYCKDGSYLVIDTLQPASRNPMSTPDFLRGYAK